MELARLLEELALVIAKLRFIEAELQKTQRARPKPYFQPNKHI
jgi:hypothetical protein